MAARPMPISSKSGSTWRISACLAARIRTRSPSLPCNAAFQVSAVLSGPIATGSASCRHCRRPRDIAQDADPRSKLLGNRLAERMHEAVGPAKDRGRQHEVELFECAQARLAELLCIVARDLDRR